jgi:hypothetical protein
MIDGVANRSCRFARILTSNTAFGTGTQNMFSAATPFQIEILALQPPIISLILRDRKFQVF